MNRKAVTIFIAFFVVMSAGAFLLLGMRSGLKLGEPGVKLVQEPIFDENKNKIAETSVALPSDVPGCISQVVPITRAELNVLPADTVYGRRYYKAENGFQAMMHVVLMGSDRTSIHKPQYCLTGQGFQIETTDVVKIPIQRPERYDLDVMKLTASTSVRAPGGGMVQRKAIYLYWFVAEGQTTPRHGDLLWRMARGLLTTGELQRWAYIGVMSQCAPGEEDALFKMMAAFVAETVPEFQLTSPSTAQASVSSLSSGVEFAKIMPTQDY